MNSIIENMSHLFQGHSIICAMLYMFGILWINSFWEEQFLKIHIFFRMFSKKKTAEIVGFKECVLAGGTGRQHYSVIKIVDANSIKFGKIARSVDDYRGRVVQVSCLFNLSYFVVRCSVERLYVMLDIHRVSISDRDYFLRMMTIKEGGAFLLCMLFYGLDDAIAGVQLCFFVLLVIYITYPFLGGIRWLMWKTNITWR